jgi:magnesium transporter
MSEADERVRAYLYDASGTDETVELDEIDIRELDESKLLWVTVLDRDEKLIRDVAERLHVDRVPFSSIAKASKRPNLFRFEGLFHFSVNSVRLDEDDRPEKLPIDFVVGKNFVVTVHDGEVEYFKDFRNRERGETHIGELSAESFVATLLDLHIVSYFQALDSIERRVDKLDARLLRKRELETNEFMSDMVELRSDTSKLRRWLIPHREMMYGFMRADFQQIAKSDSAYLYRMLGEHFESAVDAIETSRETVLSVFELYATKSSQLTNLFVQRLTFLTLMTGTLSVIAGILGMNYKEEFFESPNGFWITLGGMLLVAAALTLFARLRKWI